MEDSQTDILISFIHSSKTSSYSLILAFVSGLFGSKLKQPTRANFLCSISEALEKCSKDLSPRPKTLYFNLSNFLSVVDKYFENADAIGGSSPSPHVLVKHSKTG